MNEQRSEIDGINNNISLKNQNNKKHIKNIILAVSMSAFSLLGDNTAANAKEIILPSDSNSGFVAHTVIMNNSNTNNEGTLEGYSETISGPDEEDKVYIDTVAGYVNGNLPQRNDLFAFSGYAEYPVQDNQSSLGKPEPVPEHMYEIIRTRKNLQETRNQYIALNHSKNNILSSEVTDKLYDRYIEFMKYARHTNISQTLTIKKIETALSFLGYKVSFLV